jgi:pimeloyl-ACP methyl ester carboxylesterase
VVRYDVRGYGRSDAPDGSPYARTDDQMALMEHLGIARAHILGLSMGGMLAVDFALAYPQATRTLIAVDSALSGYRWSRDWRARWHAMADSRDVGTAKRMWLAHPLFAPANEQPAVAAALAQMVADYSGFHFFHEDGGRSTDAFSALEQIRVPVLVITGERDLQDFHAVADLLATRARACKIVIPGAGHMSPMEAPAAFNRAVLDFLAAHAA